MEMLFTRWLYSRHSRQSSKSPSRDRPDSSTITFVLTGLHNMDDKEVLDPELAGLVSALPTEASSGVLLQCIVNHSLKLERIFHPEPSFPEVDEETCRQAFEAVVQREPGEGASVAELNFLW